MILYVSATAVLNMALGFGLAMYCYRAGLLGGSRTAPAAEEPAHCEEATHVPAPQAVPSPVAQATAPAVSDAAAVPAPALSEPETAAAPAAPELEENVLAGIEEFRNQLAQMKAQPGDAAEVADAASV